MASGGDVGSPEIGALPPAAPVEGAGGGPLSLGQQKAVEDLLVEQIAQMPPQVRAGYLQKNPDISPEKVLEYRRVHGLSKGDGRPEETTVLDNAVPEQVFEGQAEAPVAEESTPLVEVEETSASAPHPEESSGNGKPPDQEILVAEPEVASVVKHAPPFAERIPAPEGVEHGFEIVRLTVEGPDGFPITHTILFPARDHSSLLNQDQLAGVADAFWDAYDAQANEITRLEEDARGQVITSYYQHVVYKEFGISPGQEDVLPKRDRRRFDERMNGVREALFGSGQQGITLPQLDKKTQQRLNSELKRITDYYNTLRAMPAEVWGCFDHVRRAQLAEDPVMDEQLQNLWKAERRWPGIEKQLQDYVTLLEQADINPDTVPPADGTASITEQSHTGARTVRGQAKIGYSPRLPLTMIQNAVGQIEKNAEALVRKYIGADPTRARVHGIIREQQGQSREDAGQTGAVSAWDTEGIVNILGTQTFLLSPDSYDSIRLADIIVTSSTHTTWEGIRAYLPVPMVEFLEDALRTAGRNRIYVLPNAAAGEWLWEQYKSAPVPEEPMEQPRPVKNGRGLLGMLLRKRH